MKAKRILIFVFVFLALLDFGFGLLGFYVNGHTLMEINPLFVLTKSLWPVILANLIVLGAIVYFYRKDTNPTINFLFVSGVVYQSAARVGVIIGEIKYILEPVPAQAMAQITAAQKVASYNYWALLSLVIPVALVLISWLIFKLDYSIKIKEVK